MKRVKNIAKLIEALEHQDSSRRRRAAQELAEGDERAIYPLLKTLRDSNPGVQDAAMRSLVAIGGEVVAYMVIPLLREDSFLRNTAQLMLKDLGAVSVPLLYPLLADKDDDIRKFALDLLGDIREGVDPARLVPLTRDPNPNVRASAIRGIGLLDYKEGAPAVESALQDEEWAAFTALETLGILKNKQSVGAVVKLLRTGSPTIRHAALETLGLIGSSMASDALLMHIMRASEPEEKTLAVKGLVEIGVTPSMSGVGEILRQMLAGDSPWEDRLIAIQGLVDIRDHESVRMIVDLAGSLDESVPGEDDILLRIKRLMEGFGPSDVYADVLHDPKIKFKGKVLVAELAGKTRSASAVPALIEQLRTNIRDLRRAAAHAMGLIGTDEARKALVGLVDDHESNVRKMAITCLGLVPHTDSFEPLLRRLDTEPYNDVIEEIIKSLLRIEPSRLAGLMGGFRPQVREAVARFSTDVDILLQLSRDAEPGVKLPAISSLGGLSDRRASERIVEAIHDSDPEVRRTAVMALGAMEMGPDSLKPLLGDPDMWVRVHAVRSLGNSLRQDMIETIAPLLADAEIPVVLAAVEAMALIGGRDAFSSLSAMAGHKDESVRQAVAEVLARF